jgi:hypothetical protein
LLLFPFTIIYLLLQPFFDQKSCTSPACMIFLVCGHVPAGFLPGQQLADLLAHGLQVRRDGLRTTCAEADATGPAVVSV